MERAMNKNNHIYFNLKPIDLPNPVALPPGGDSPSGEGFSIGQNVTFPKGTYYIIMLTSVRLSKALRMLQSVTDVTNGR
jgi:hypothetical protein